jgi:REP element-mobilizing transposase RayT
MVIAHHLIFTAYGWWLPNDPRGSSSHEIRVEQIAGLGELHPGRKPTQPLPRDLREFYAAAELVLKHKLLTFSSQERDELAEAFGKTIKQWRYTCYACAIMPDHVHLLIRRHRDQAEDMMARLQESSRDRLRDRKLRPDVHPVWGGPGWKVFVDTPERMRRTIQYIEQNPVKLGRPIQRWGFVKEYDGWVPGLYLR